MRISEYLNKKYGILRATTLTKSEARILNIPYPLRAGWLQQFGGVHITREQANRIMASITARSRNPKPKRIEHDRRALEVLTTEYSPLGAIAPAMHERPKHPKRKKRPAPKTVKHKVAWESTDAFLASYEWRKLRMEALKKYGSRCQCCGATPEHGVRMHVDHIKPRRLFPGLALTLSNLQILCEVCNHGKGNWDMTDWRLEHAE